MDSPGRAELGERSAGGGSGMRVEVDDGDEVRSCLRFLVLGSEEEVLADGFEWWEMERPRATRVSEMPFVSG